MSLTCFVLFLILPWYNNVNSRPFVLTLVNHAALVCVPQKVSNHLAQRVLINYLPSVINARHKVRCVMPHYLFTAYHSVHTACEG